ncbi:hypothetical protein CFE70_000895 [Pyrenophora teres f. teres 0-1]
MPAGSPQVVDSWTLIGQGYLKSGMFNEAKDGTEKAVTVYKAIETESARNDLALARKKMGLIFEELGQMAEAREIWLQVADIDVDESKITVNSPVSD